MTYEEFGIEGVVEHKTTEQKVLCPKCSWDRKKNNQKCLYVNAVKKTWYCQHCHWTGGLFDMKDLKLEQKVYVKPPETNRTALHQTTVDFFLARGISTFVLNRNKITDGVDGMMQKATGKYEDKRCVHFNYYRDGELINIKYRDSSKNFKLVKDAEMIFYGLDDIKGQKEIIICEGEPDKLSWEMAGFVNCVSVPRGAAPQNNKLDYYDNCYHGYFEKATKVYLATDNDPAGIGLKNDLAYRVGVEKCWVVQYPQNCKDANDVLINTLYGVDHLKAMIANARPWPIKGVATQGGASERWLHYHFFGAPEGNLLNMWGLDRLFTVKEGVTTVVTGQPNSGKSDLVDEFALRMAVFHDWKFAVFSPENWPIEIHITKLMEKYLGMSLYQRKDADIDMISEALFFILEHFYFIEIQDEEDIDLSVEGIINIGKELKKSVGIKGMIIDPWNVVEHKRPKHLSETEYIGESLSRITRFSKISQVHTFIVAHPVKLKKDADGMYPVATLYDIAGSSNWYNKCDVGISVKRHFNPDKVDQSLGDEVTVHIQKMRFKWMGKIGHTDLQYDLKSGLYTPKGVDPMGIKYLHKKPINYRDISESMNQNDAPY